MFVLDKYNFTIEKRSCPVRLQNISSYTHVHVSNEGRHDFCNFLTSCRLSTRTKPLRCLTARYKISTFFCLSCFSYTQYLNCSLGLTCETLQRTEYKKECQKWHKNANIVDKILKNVRILNTTKDTENCK